MAMKAFCIRGGTCSSERAIAFCINFRPLAPSARDEQREIRLAARGNIQ